jgi:hypothetical protein
MSFLTDKLAFNQKVEGWGKRNLGELKQEVRKHKKGSSAFNQIQQMMSGHKSLESSLKDKYGKSNGEIIRVTYALERHGIFWSKGLGKGYKSNGGVVVRTGGGPIMRKPAPWFNPVLDKNLPQLATIATDNVATAAVNTSNVLIK